MAVKETALVLVEQIDKALKSDEEEKDRMLEKVKDFLLWFIIEKH